MKYQTISMKRFFPAKGTIYYVAIATVIFFTIQVWRYHIFARKLTWYFIGVYIIRPIIIHCTHYLPSHSAKSLRLILEMSTTYRSGRIKAGRWNERVRAKRCGLGSNYGPHAQIKETVNIKGISGKRVMSLKGFVNRLSNYCQIDIRELKEPRRCSRLRRLLTGKRLSQ